MSEKCIVVGGGIIGLSIAYELASRGMSVELLEKDQCGEKASWAGAGIITPSNGQTAIHPLEHLESLSHRLHREWSVELKRSTQIDTGFRDCGGLYLARTPGEVAALAGVMEQWRERAIQFEVLSQNDMESRFEKFATLNVTNQGRALWVPGEAQFSNVFQVQALVAACLQMGVTIREQVGDVQLKAGKGRIDSVSVAKQSHTADHYVLCAGPWTEALVEPLGMRLPMQPVRGQIALYQLDADSRRTIANGPIINEGSRYLVPRVDGHVLAGSTIEEVGFDCQTTEREVANLRNWAESLSHCFNDATFVKAWAGLRPGTYDGFPYLGPVEGIENAYVATGHFKGGLQLSTGTAVAIADLIENKTPAIDLQPFLPSRIAHHQSTDIK